MKYKYNGQWVDVNIKALDSMPIGTIVDYDGETTDIPTGWEAVGNNYSTTEINTGKTWIDGKPIYRKVIEATNIGTAFSTGVSNIDTFMFDVSHSYIYYDSNIFFASDRAAFLYNKSSNTIKTENTALATWSAKLTIEYTKSTD